MTISVSDRLHTGILSMKFHIGRQHF